jgi:hypothetical protein
VFDDAHRTVSAELRRTGELVDSNELDPDDATVIGTHRGRGLSMRQPFTEGVETVGGYYVVDVASRDRAVEIAGLLAETRFSPVEIRRLMH